MWLHILNCGFEGELQVDNTARFDGKGEIYARARPSYAAELFVYMKNTLQIEEGSVFADIGAGTGIFSRHLLNNGYRVYGVEPNADMRKKAEETLSGYRGFTLVDGADHNTNLPSRSVDYIAAAQAFHWFNAAAFKRECRRILRPDGKIFIVYNIRDESAECSRALAGIHRRYCPDFQGFSKGMNDEKCCAFFDGRCDIFRADNSRMYDRQGYINRVLSSSYSLHENDAEYGEYLAGVNRIFDQFSKDGFMSVPMQTAAYIGNIS